MCQVMQRYENIARTEAADELSSLMQKLFKEGRMDDAIRVAGDKEYRERLLQEFRLLPQ